MTSSILRRPVARKSRPRIGCQLGKVTEELEDLRDYVELLEARFENQSKRRFSSHEARQKLQL